MTAQNYLWKISNLINRLESNRRIAIRKWNVPEIDRLNKLIKEKKHEFSTLIDNLKMIAA